MYKNIIGIFGVPRSGTSWLGQIFNSSPETRFAYQPMFTEKFRDKIHTRSSKNQMRDYFKLIYNEQEDFLTQNDNMDKGRIILFKKYSNMPENFVFKEVMYLYMIPHFLRNLSEMKVIFILRNPYDVLKSWFNAPKEFYNEWNIKEEWMFAQSKNFFLPERYYGYHRWKEAVVIAKQMMDDFPKRFYVIRYEDLNERPIECSKDLFEFSGLKWQEQTKQFIIDSRSKTEENPYSVYRDPNDNNRNICELPADIVDDIRVDMKNFNEVKMWYENIY